MKWLLVNGVPSDATNSEYLMHRTHTDAKRKDGGQSRAYVVCAQGGIPTSALAPFTRKTRVSFMSSSYTLTRLRSSAV